MGGFFFDFEAVRTDLTEMLRAGTVKLSDFGESVRRPTSGGLDDDDSEDDSDEDGDDVKDVLGRLRRETAKTRKRQVYSAPDRIQQTP